jgi:LPS-assembly lipoprotein
MFALSACGWHVRGAMDLPKNLSQIYISATDSKGALMTDLRQLLKTNRVSLVENAADANCVLTILEETKDRHTAGVGGNELSSSYEITLKVDYEIQLKNSDLVTRSSAISIRNFNYNTSTINSATQEELLLDQEMRRDLAQQILRRLSAATNSTNSKETPASGLKNGKTTPRTTQ